MGYAMSDEWLPDAKPPKIARLTTPDRRPLSERSKLIDRGLVDFRRVCDEMGILDRERDAIIPNSAKYRD